MFWFDRRRVGKSKNTLIAFSVVYSIKIEENIEENWRKNSINNTILKKENEWNYLANVFKLVSNQNINTV